MVRTLLCRVCSISGLVDASLCSAWRHKIAGRDVCAQALKYSSTWARRWQQDRRAIDCISILMLTGQSDVQHLCCCSFRYVGCQRNSLKHSPERGHHEHWNGEVQHTMNPKADLCRIKTARAVIMTLHKSTCLCSMEVKAMQQSLLKNRPDQMPSATFLSLA